MTSLDNIGRWDAYITLSAIAGKSWFIDSDYDNTKIVSEPSTANKVIGVGSYNSKNSWIDYNGHTQTKNGYPINQISYFSSSGPSRDGREKPDIFAPGAWVASTSSSDVVLIVDNFARDFVHYHSIGTSLSAPFVTGTVALLLAQDNDYTYEDIIDILNESKTPQGYLDVYQAILLHYQDPLLPIRKNPLARSLNKQFYFYDFEPEILFSAKRNKIN